MATSGTTTTTTESGKSTTVVHVRAPQPQPSLTDRLAHRTGVTGKIIGLMALTAIFGVVGAETRTAQVKTTLHNTEDKLGYVLGSPFLVIAGAAVATVICVGLASFGGDVGETLGLGLATVAFVATVLVDGGPVWRGIGDLFSAAPGPTYTKKSTTKSKGTA